MAYQQNQKTAKSDLVITTAEHGKIAIELKWKQLRGRPEVSSITITPVDQSVPFEPVMLRQIRWANIIRTQRQELFQIKEPNTQRRPQGVGPDSTRTLTDGDLQYVADLYIEAWQLNLPVQKHVADALNIAIPTAARRIGLARRRGLISRDINPPTNK